METQIEDAYAAHVARLRAQQEQPRIGTLSLPAGDLKALSDLLFAVSRLGTVPAEDKRTYERIDRQVLRAYREAQ